MSSALRVLLTDRAWPDNVVEREILAPSGAEIIEPEDTSEAALVAAAADCDAIGTCWAAIPAAVIDAAPRLKCISRFGIGLDNIDVARATERGIPVSNVPDYCVEEVADHTLALLLAITRQTGWYHLQTKRGQYERQSGRELRRLSTLTVGLIGFGRTGQAVYQRARAFGFQLQACSRTGDNAGTGCPMVPLDRLLATSDCVSLHLPLNSETRLLLGEKQFAGMKEGAALINTARGGLIDHEALYGAIQSGQISAAALDVFDPEPPDLDTPLLADARVIATPHAAFLSRESLRDLRTRASFHLLQALQGHRPDQVVNPSIYGPSA